MIKHVKGDIFSEASDDGTTIICHQVNCRGVMGAGIAKTVKKLFPDVYKVYKEKCKDAGNHKTELLGQVQLCHTKLLGNDYLIANIFGQYSYGYGALYTEYDALREAFNTLVGMLIPTSDFTIRIPYMMGCGLAGGDWNTVKEIIDDTLVKAGCKVEIWEL